MSIDLSKTYQTRDGQKVAGLRMRENPIYPIVGRVNGGRECWTANGRFWSENSTSPRDLVEVTEPEELRHVD